MTLHFNINFKDFLSYEPFCVLMKLHSATVKIIAGLGKERYVASQPLGIGFRTENGCLLFSDVIYD